MKKQKFKINIMNMKNYKQILEAINMGIQFALDDFEPEEVELSKPKQQAISKDDSLWKSIKFREQWIDLGLPSGTLWCIQNLKNSNGNAEYYSWGETAPKKPIKNQFIWKNYKFVNPQFGFSDVVFTKYFDNRNNLLLEPIDDPVTIKYNNTHYHIPTVKQAEELLQYTEIKYLKWTETEDEKDGWLLKSRINDNFIFFQNFGVCEESGVINWGNTMFGIWLNELMPSSFSSQPQCAKALIFDKNVNNSRIYGMYRYKGVCIRPVYEP